VTRSRSRSRRRGAFRGVDAFDQHAHLAGLAVGGVAVCVPARLPPTSTRSSAPTGVTASSAHMSRPFGIDCSCSHLEVLLHARSTWCRSPGRAADRDGFLQRRERELDVHSWRRTTQRGYEMPARLSVLKAGQYVRQLVSSGRQRWEAVSYPFPTFTAVWHMRRRAVAVTVTRANTAPCASGDATLNRAGAAGAATLCKRAARECNVTSRASSPSSKTSCVLPPVGRPAGPASRARQGDTIQITRTNDERSKRATRRREHGRTRMWGGRRPDKDAAQQLQRLTN
jgi:hypothetical protein